MEKAQNNCVPAPQHQTNKHTEHCGWWTFHQLNNWISAAIKKVETNANFATLHKFAISTFKGDHIFLQLGFTLANKSVIAGLSKGTVRVAQTLALLFFHSYQEYQPLKWIYNQSCPKKLQNIFFFLSQSDVLLFLQIGVNICFQGTFAHLTILKTINLPNFPSQLWH